jgi:hypothetical protein
LLCNGAINASTTEKLFSAWSVPRSYLEDNWRYKAVCMDQEIEIKHLEVSDFKSQTQKIEEA